MLRHWFLHAANIRIFPYTAKKHFSFRQLYFFFFFFFRNWRIFIFDNYFFFSFYFLLVTFLFFLFFLFVQRVENQTNAKAGALLL